MSLDSFKEKSEVLDFGIKVEDEEDLLDLSDYEKFNVNELEAGIELKGKPFLMYFENDDGDERTYESVRLQLINKEDKEVVNIYCNIPLGYPVIKNIRRNNGFYKNTYNFITGLYHVDDKLDETVFYDSRGKMKNTIKTINLGAIIKYVNAKKMLTVKVIENGDYNSIEVVKIE